MASKEGEILSCGPAQPGIGPITATCTSFGGVWPWLVLDRNGNGAIDDGSELFGSMTVLTSGARAPNGFAALAELDRDGDGAITPADPAWSALRLWSDADQDRASAPRELRTLDAAGVVSIDLRYRVEPRCAAAACEMERARFTWRRGGDLREGAVVDVHFAVR